MMELVPIKNPIGNFSKQPVIGMEVFYHPIIIY